LVALRLVVPVAGDGLRLVPVVPVAVWCAAMGAG
jgi:hypothetical protein